MFYRGQLLLSNLGPQAVSSPQKIPIRFTPLLRSNKKKQKLCGKLAICPESSALYGPKIASPARPGPSLPLIFFYVFDNFSVLQPNLSYQSTRQSALLPTADITETVLYVVKFSFPETQLSVEYATVLKQ